MRGARSGETGVYTPVHEDFDGPSNKAEWARSSFTLDFRD